MTVKIGYWHVDTLQYFLFYCMKVVRIIISYSQIDVHGSSCPTGILILRKYGATTKF